jgi:hypothetical protein
MTLTITHAFVSAKPEGADTTVVRPSNWNAGHTLASNSTSGKMLKADTNGLPADATNTDAEVAAAVGGTFTQVKTPEIKTDTSAATDLTITTGAAKTLVLATSVYNDINFSVGRGKIGGASPNWQPFCTDTHNNAYQFDINEWIDLGSAEMLHNWKEGTTITPHVHIVLSAALAAEEKVKFQLYYSIGDGDELMSAEASVVGEATIANGTAARTHVRIDFGTIALPTYKIGAMIICQLWRVAKSAGGTELSDEPFVVNVGLHYEIDTLGSRSIAVK